MIGKTVLESHLTGERLMDRATTAYKDFLAEVTDGRLRVWHYNHDEDRCEGQHQVREIRSYFLWRWGLAAESGTDWHSGGVAGADVHTKTAAEIRSLLEFVSCNDDEQIESACKDWAKTRGLDPYRVDTIRNGRFLLLRHENSQRRAQQSANGILLRFEIPDSLDEREQALNDDELAEFWAWAVENERFE